LSTSSGLDLPASLHFPEVNGNPGAQEQGPEQQRQQPRGEPDGHRADVEQIGAGQETQTMPSGFSPARYFSSSSCNLALLVVKTWTISVDPVNREPN